MAKIYTKTLTLTMSDGSTKVLTGTAADLFARKLEDDPRIKKILEDKDGETVTNYYNLGESGCGFCLVATASTAETEGPDTVCENGLPGACDTYGITLDKETASVAVGATTTITATATPASGVVTWSTSDATKATVSNAGVVTGVAAGSATITATMRDGDAYYTASATVTVIGA